MIWGGAFLVMLALGSWQVQRLAWKSDLIAERHARLALPAEPLPSVLADPALWDYRRVRVEGRFLNEREFYLGARSLNGNVGYHVLTPLLRPGGEAVLIDRGWVPLALQDPALRHEGRIEGETAIEGVLRLPRAPGWPVPENRPEENFWLWPDLEALSAEAGVALAPFYVEAGAAPNPGGYPIGGQTRIDIPNDHLQYAITWYALALALAVIFVLYHRRRAEPPAPPA